MPLWTRSPRYILLGLLLLCSLTLTLWRGADLPYIDERDYQALAINVAEGRGYVEGEDFHVTAYRPPGYPFVLAALFKIHPSPILPKVINGLALFGIALVLMAFTQRVLPKAANWVPVLVLLNPLALYSASTLYPQIFGSLLFLSSLYLLTFYRSHRWALALAGLLYGYLVLTIPSFLYIAPFVALYLWLEGRWPTLASTLRTSLFCLCMILVVAPWTYRNWVQLQAIVPVSTNGGVNLLYGNSENTRYNTGGDLDIDAYKVIGFTLSEVDADRYYKESALKWIKAHPQEAVTLYLGKFLNHFHFYNELYTAGQTSIVSKLVVFFTYYPLLLLCWMRWRWRGQISMTRVEQFVMVLYVINALLSAIFFTRLRFRIPFDLTLIPLAAIALQLLWEKYGHKLRLHRRVAQNVTNGCDETKTSAS